MGDEQTRAGAGSLLNFREVKERAGSEIDSSPRGPLDNPCREKNQLLGGMVRSLRQLTNPVAAGFPGETCLGIFVRGLGSSMLLLFAFGDCVIYGNGMLSR